MGGGGVPRGPRRGSAAARRRVGGAWDTVGVEVVRVGEKWEAVRTLRIIGGRLGSGYGLGVGAPWAGL